MLEPTYQNSYTAEGDAGDNQLSHFNRKDLEIAGNWALFLAIISILSLLWNLYNSIQLLEYIQYMGPQILISTLVSFGITSATVYWYFVFYNSNRKIGQGNTSEIVVDRMTSAVLAIFRLWGVLSIVVIVYVVFSIILGIRYL